MRGDAIVAGVVALALGAACRSGTAVTARARRGATAAAAAGPGVAVVDLVEPLRLGAIDSAGPVVDLGEPQAAAFLVGSGPVSTEVVNGTSWAAFGRRVRLRVPLTPDGAIDEPTMLPTSVRMRLRRASARAVAVVVDGLLVRSAALPPTDGAVLSLDVPSDRFRHPVAEVELRFAGTRAPAAPPTPGAPGAVVELDWVHLARQPTEPARVADLVSEVRLGPLPRRALTLHTPTTLSAVMVVPPGATWRASLAAEGPRGGSAPLPNVTARLVAEADGAAPLEVRAAVAPNTRWQDVSLDLSAFGGRPARLAVVAEGGGAGVRLAVASPRLEHPAPPPPAAPRPVRHVVLAVVRGARLDRFVPALSPRLSAGGFARMVREGLVAPALAPAGREVSALLSATTGLGADAHRVTEVTDLLDDEAPALGSALAGQGPVVRAFTDDLAWFGSGADRDAAARIACPNDAATCPPQGVFAAAAEDLVQNREQSTLTLVVTRAGQVPFAPTPEALQALAPEPYEGTLTPAQTGVLAARARRGALALEASEQERLGLLYDAAMLDVDRGLAGLLDRVRDAGLEGSTVVIVVGDRGTALGDGGAVGDGPMTLAAVATTVLMARGPGLAPRRIDGVVGVVDAVATAIERLGAAAPPELDGASLATLGPAYARVLSFVASRRGEVGVRFGDLLAVPRPGAVALYAPAEDPLGQTDLAATRPIARAFAEAALASRRPGAGERRVFQPSTRALPAPVEAAMRR